MSKMIYDELPPSVILCGRQYTALLSMTNLGFKLCKEDANFIIESLIAKFLSLNDPTVLEYRVEVPDFNGMRDTSIRDDPTKHEKLMKAIQQIEQDMYITLNQMGLFEERQQFSYALDRFLGGDIVIFKLPH